MTDISSGSGQGTPSLVDARGGLEGEYPYCVKLNQITANAATPAEVSFENVKINILTKYPKFSEIPEYDEVHTSTQPIHLVGAGPSLKDTLAELKEAKGPIIACGGPYDWLIEHGIVPEYCTICDPDPVTANYITKANRKTLFLLSTAVHPSVVQKLRGFNICFWHCHSDANEERIKEIDPCYQAIGGGCTVGLRTLSLAICMGYSNLHFWGFDSCLGDNDAHHAYEFSDESEEIGKIYRIRIGFDGPGSKLYRAAGYQLAQAEQFKTFYGKFCSYFTPTFHGPGLLPDVYEAIQRRIETEANNQLNKEAGVL